MLINLCTAFGVLRDTSRFFIHLTENRNIKCLSLIIGLEQWQDNLRRIASVVSDIDKRKETVMVSSIRAADGQVWMTKTQEEQKDEAAPGRTH